MLFGNTSTAWASSRMKSLLISYTRFGGKVFSPLYELQKLLLTRDQTGISVCGSLLNDLGEDPRHHILQAFGSWHIFGVFGRLMQFDTPSRAWFISNPVALALSWIEVGYKHSFSLEGIPPVDIFELHS